MNNNIIPQTSYIICATPRSGSTLLCEALKNTSLAGIPDEYFGPMHVSRWNDQWHTKSDAEYVRKTLETGTTPNGVFGVKIMNVYWNHFINQLQNAQNQNECPIPQLVSSIFPNVHYIWITRRNKVQQAVSWCKFLQGVAWYWTKEEPQVLKKEPVFNYDIIDEFIQQVVMAEAAWQAYFEACGIVPHVVVYEDFAQSYEPTALGILKYLKIPIPENLQFQPRKLKKQADATSEEWVQKYRDLKQKN